MKNVTKLFALLFLTALSYSCTPQSLTDNEPNNAINITDTGGNTSSELDNDKDGD